VVPLCTSPQLRPAPTRFGLQSRDAYRMTEHRQTILIEPRRSGPLAGLERPPSGVGAGEAVAWCYQHRIIPGEIRGAGRLLILPEVNANHPAPSGHARSATRPSKRVPWLLKCAGAFPSKA